MKYLYLLAILLFSVAAHAQETVIRGKVITEDQKPLSGVSLHLQRSKQGAASHSDGSFSLFTSVPTDTLLVSFLGYETRVVPVATPLKAPLVIILKGRNNSVEEVTVSTGYYQVPQERATGSFTNLSGKTLNTSVSTDILSRLEGVAGSVSFDNRTGQQNISIRGLSTIYANAQPLIVLNNFPYDGDINDINPNDVESITILKDAASASIWGVRAANGVIVITTKKGTINHPAEISFHTNFTYGNKPDVFKIPMTSSADYIGVEKYLFSNGFYDPALTDPSHPPLTPAVQLMYDQQNGQITQAQLDQQLNALSKLDVRNDFNKYLYQNSFDQQYFLSAKGGGDKSTYYYSAGFDHNADDLNNRYSRVSVRADNTFSITKDFRLNPVIGFTHSVTTMGRPDYTSVLPSALGRSIYPYAQFTDAKGNPAAIVTDYNTDFIQQAGAAGLLDWNYRPLDDFNDRQTVTNLNDVLIGLNMDYSFLRHFDFQGQYQYENVGSELSDLYDAGSYFVRNLVNSYTQVDDSGNLSFPVPQGGILNNNNTYQSSQTGRVQLKYNNSWGKNDLALLAGAEVRQIHAHSYGYTTYGYNESGLTSVPVDHVTLFPQYDDPGNIEGIPDNTSFIDLTNRYTSVYANASYTYDNRYIFSGSARKDESNLFGVNSNQKGVPLWSVGAAWNLHNEKFFPQGWVNYLKLRLTYGYNGNLSQNLTAVASLLQTTGNLNNQPYAIVSTYPNPDLSWEKVGVINLGLDFGTRKNVLSGSIEVYRKNGNDLIGKEPIDPTVGIPTGVITRNVADMQTNGLDLQLTSKNIDRTFKWQTGLLFSISSDKVTAYQNPTASGSSLISSGLSVTPVVGQPLYNIISYKWAGLDPKTGDPMGYVNGQPSEDYTTITSKTPVADLVLNKPALPPYFGSLANTFSYDGFSLYINITYRFGYYFRKTSVSYYYLYNNGLGNSDFANRWQRPGDELHTYVPSMPSIDDNSYARDSFYINSSVLVQRADNIRLQELNLSYRPHFGKKRWLGLSDAEFYAYAKNLGILWRANKSEIDPDYASGMLPPSYSLSFGVKARF
ncbi:MAG: SusC/RagA family TonB-linked outer membrane protein [Mucilaginibacter sp.]